MSHAKLLFVHLIILGQIFSLLRPLDLLHLTWTTKALRAVLTRRSSAWVWKVSLATLAELPPCPEDLTEIQWTHLVFYAHCHVCTVYLHLGESLSSSISVLRHNERQNSVLVLSFEGLQGMLEKLGIVSVSPLGFC